MPGSGAKPCHDSRIGLQFRRLTQNVGAHQVLHSVSVDSELPSRTPDKAIVPTVGPLDVELLPASMRSIFRNSAGRTIWPLEETVVFT